MVEEGKEVKEMSGEVIASTFDEPAERHVKIAGIVLEKAKHTNPLTSSRKESRI